MHHVAKQLNAVRAELGSFYRERDEVLYAMMLAVLAKQHGFILGSPGTAKTRLIRSLVEAFSGASYFETSLSKNRPAEAVLGPVDLTAYRERNEYKLKREGFASMVQFVMLDEVGKMSPVLGHDLLTLANDRLIQEVNGKLSTRPSPLMTMFTASNEMLTTQSEDAAAFWDRLLVRVVVESIMDRKNFMHLLTAPEPVFTETVDIADLIDVIDNEVPAITWTDDAMMTTLSLREKLRQENLEPSDRRFRQSVRILQAAAFLDGRSEITEDDIGALRFTLWDTVETKDKVERMCLTAANPFHEQLMEVRSGIQELAAQITEKVTTATEGEQTSFGRTVNDKLNTARTLLDSLMRQSPNKPIPGFKAVADLHETVQLDNFVRMMGQDPDIAEIAVAKRLGLGNGEKYWTGV